MRMKTIQKENQFIKQARITWIEHYLIKQINIAEEPKKKEQEKKNICSTFQLFTVTEIEISQTKLSHVNKKK